MKKLLSLFLALAMLAGLVPALAEPDPSALPAVGDVVEGFEVIATREYGLFGAQLILFEHQQTGAKLLYIANDDTNRAFQLTFITRQENDMGLPHIFEHATLSGSVKYPSTSIWNNASMQTYNTYMNAYTMDAMTGFPVASLSEAQLLRLADMYTDMCLNPRVMEDESIFRTEAWRYEMADADADLTYSGTVYSEMLGALTLTTSGLTAANKATFPGASVSYQYGGIPDVIPDLTWQDVKDYHLRYYHPSNCLVLLYGSFEDYAAFLRLLNEAFAPYDRKDFSFEEPAYTRITEPVVSTYAYPVPEGTDTAAQSAIFYYILCPGMRDDPRQEQLIDHACELLAASGSPLMIALKEAFPSGSFSIGREVAAPDDAIIIYGTGLNEGDAELFRQTADEVLSAVAQDGFAPELVDSIITSLKFDAKLSSEGGNPVETVLQDIAYTYAVTGDIFRSVSDYEALNNIGSENAEGLLAESIGTWLVNPALYTLTTACPAPGQQEVKDAALAAKLAEIKAGMTEEEKQAVIDATNAEPVKEDTSALIDSLTAVTVATLPEEIREYEVRDETGDDGVRRIEAVTGVDGISYISLNLDAAALPQEDIHYMRLYTRLLGKMDTDAHSWQELAPLISRYLYNSTFGVFVSGWKGSCHPYMVAEWYALDEDLAAGYELAEEILFHTQFTDTETLLKRIQDQKDACRQQISGNALSVLLYRQLGISDPLARYYSYLNFLEYYAFLEELEQEMLEHPEEVVARLGRVQQYFASRSGAVGAFAGCEESLALNRPLADAFFAKLDGTPRDPVEYDLPAAAKKEGLIVDSNIQFNMVSAPWTVIDPEADGQAYAALATLVSDVLLWPDLRDQGGAYGAYAVSSESEMYIYTYRDPNVAATFAYFDSLPDKVDALTANQATIDNYIINDYAQLATPEGDLTGAVTLLNNRISGKPDDLVLQSMRALKSATPESLKAFALCVANLVNTDVRSSAGSASAITANADLYDVVLNPFHTEAVEAASIGDIPEDHPHAAAIAAVLDAGAMTAADGMFRPDDPASQGDLMYAFYVLGFGSAPSDAGAAYETLAGYGLVPQGLDMADELSFDALNSELKQFLKAGYDFDLDETMSGEGEIVTRGELAGVLFYIWLEE